MPAAICAAIRAATPRASATSSSYAVTVGGSTCDASAAVPCARARRASGGELERARAAAHELVRDREDRGIRSVVRLEPNDAGVLVAARELEEEARVGAGERVDRLARVADDADVAAIAEPQLEQAVLQRRDVLELVDGEVAVLLVDGARDVRLGLEHARAGEQDVLEVELPPLVLELLVRALQVGDALDARAGRRRSAAPRRTASMLRIVTLRHSISLATSRSVAVSGSMPMPSAACASSRTLLSTMPGSGVAGERRPEVVELRERGGVERARRDALDARARAAGRASRRPPSP